jgi:hypothetical protein
MSRFFDAAMRRGLVDSNCRKVQTGYRTGTARDKRSSLGAQVTLQMHDVAPGAVAAIVPLVPGEPACRILRGHAGGKPPATWIGVRSFPFFSMVADCCRVMSSKPDPEVMPLSSHTFGRVANASCYR